MLVAIYILIGIIIALLFCCSLSQRSGECISVIIFWPLAVLLFVAITIQLLIKNYKNL